jgi:hypothetical protein
MDTNNVSANMQVRKPAHSGRSVVASFLRTLWRDVSCHTPNGLHGYTFPHLQNPIGANVLFKIIMEVIKILERKRLSNLR